MARPEQEPENSPEHNPNLKPEGPKLDAILPDDLPPAAAELVGDIDSYQKRMEREWESARVAYEDKINRIMDEFSSARSTIPEEPVKKQKPREERLKNLMGELEEETRRADRAAKRIPKRPGSSAEPLQLGWTVPARMQWKKYLPWVGGLLSLIGGGGFFLSSQSIRVDTLPYTHTLGPVVWKNNIYIIDWFRKSLYIHEDKSGLPIKAVEPVANTLATGFAMSEKTLWTLDGLDRKILLHAVTPDHQVNSTIDTQGMKPSGLFYDGLDLWSADQDAKKLYRHRGNDIEDIRDTFPLPEINVTAFGFFNNRLWLLDGKSRLINVYRLQKPLLQLGSFDLDPFVEGATPTGFTIHEKKIWVVTENPVSLIRFPLSRLKKSKTEAF